MEKIPDIQQHMNIDVNIPTAYIQIEGLLSNSEPKTWKYALDPQHIFVYFNYNSKNIINDIICLTSDRKSIKSFWKEKRGWPILTRLDRVTELRDLIIKYVENPDYKRVVLIGVSHGSIILQGALILVKVKIHIKHSAILKKFDLMSKIHMYTIGSPQPAPAKLITPWEDTKKQYKLLNMYNRKDEKYTNRLVQFFFSDESLTEFYKHIRSYQVSPESDPNVFKMRMHTNFNENRMIMNLSDIPFTKNYHISLYTLYNILRDNVPTLNEDTLNKISSNSNLDPEKSNSDSLNTILKDQNQVKQLIYYLRFLKSINPTCDFCDNMKTILSFIETYYYTKTTGGDPIYNALAKIIIDDLKYESLYTDANLTKSILNNDDNISIIFNEISNIFNEPNKPNKPNKPITLLGIINDIKNFKTFIYLNLKIKDSIVQKHIILLNKYEKYNYNNRIFNYLYLTQYNDLFSDPGKNPEYITQELKGGDPEEPLVCTRKPINEDYEKINSIITFFEKESITENERAFLKNNIVYTCMVVNMNGYNVDNVKRLGIDIELFNEKYNEMYGEMLPQLTTAGGNVLRNLYAKYNNMKRKNRKSFIGKV